MDLGIGQARLYEGKNYNIIDCNITISSDESCTDANPCNPLIIMSSNIEYSTPICEIISYKV